MNPTPPVLTQETRDKWARLLANRTADDNGATFSAKSPTILQIVIDLFSKTKIHVLINVGLLLAPFRRLTTRRSPPKLPQYTLAEAPLDTAISDLFYHQSEVNSERQARSRIQETLQESIQVAEAALGHTGVPEAASISDLVHKQLEMQKLLKAAKKSEVDLSNLIVSYSLKQMVSKNNFEISELQKTLESPVDANVPPGKAVEVLKILILQRNRLKNAIKTLDERLDQSTAGNG